MYLKRLEIQGFKSFAQKTVLDFLPPVDGRFSVTGVVGPNGSGKSNITDAIRWVMGETSLKAIRGKKSEDVIFGGSLSKGQLSAAEVTMVLDNTGNKIGLDFPEITLTRRLYRSGEGEYLINNNSCRLLDIHLLLARAQFAEHSYSIVSQGMIDKLLIVGPAERKDFLDEASGIKEHQIKQHQATLKLARTRENMEQAERLIAEVEPRLKLLARQVKKLEKRQEVETGLRAAQESYYVTLYTRHGEEMKSVEEKLKTVEADYRLAFGELEKIQTELSDLARAASRQEVFVALQGKHQEAVRAQNDWERQLAILEGKMQTQYQEAGKGNIGWLQNKLNELKAKRAAFVAQFELAEKEITGSDSRVSEWRRALEKLSIEKTEKTVQISRLQSTLLQNQSEQNFFQYSGLTTVKAVLEAKNNFGGKVYGIVAELGEVAEEYRLALDVSAGANLSSVVVEDDETGKRAIEYLRAHKLGVASFLPINKIQGRGVGSDAQNVLSEPGVVGLAIDLVKFSDRYQPIFSYIFGDTVVVRDLASAQRIGIGRCRMVTLDGDLIEKRGVMKGGWRGHHKGVSFNSRLSLSTEERTREFQTQINLEQQNLLDIEHRLDDAKRKLLEGEVEAQNLKNKLETHRSERGELDKEIGGIEKELSFLQISPEQYGAYMVKLSQEKDLFKKELARAQKLVAERAAELAEFNDNEEKKKQRVFGLQNEMQVRQNEVNNILNTRNDLKIQAAKLETKLEDLLTEGQNEMNASILTVVERNPATVKPEELAGVAESIQKLKYQLSLIGGIDEDVTAEYSTTKERYDFLSTQIADLRSASDDLETMIEELDDLMKKKRATEFKKIRKEFDRYFKILFNGGHADLTELYGEPETEEGEIAGAATNIAGNAFDNQSPMEKDINLSDEQPKKKHNEKVLYGIDISANPPGKKIKHINALSGGERTLTSIALICAILNCNPSPFVVLDEVEAALDEANTQRFVKIMAELSRQSQFIVITHNRVTMHAASALYGVTMGTDGISKLLSVRIEDAPKFEPASAIDKNA
ncbi:MAG: AAA family ATPase [Candidatus Magasanikbacteria bacterium]